MKIAEALNIIDEGWVKKKRGFRVHFQKQVDSEFITDYVPNKEEKPLESDVVTWRLAWKLFQAAKSENPVTGEGEMVNIYVVDDLGNPVKSYATNQLQIYNEKDMGESPTYLSAKNTNS